MSNKIGVSIQEKIENVFNLSSSISSRNIGMLMERTRGIPNEPVLITSLEQDIKIFGGKDANMYSPDVVEAIFNNSGGFSTNIWGVRIAGAASTAASVAVVNKQPDTQTITASLNQAAGASQAQITHVTVENVNIGDEFTVTLNGTDFDFTATQATVENVIAGLEAAINGGSEPVTASSPSSTLIITADANNTAFTVAVATANAATPSDALFTVHAGRLGVKDPGTWANNTIKVKVYPVGNAEGSSEGYLLEVYSSDTLVESFVAATFAALETLVNTTSEYVMIVEDDYTNDLTLSVFEGTLTGGTYVAPEDDDFFPDVNESTLANEGMKIFEGQDVQILCCPEVSSTTFVQECESFAAANDMFFVFNMPYLASTATVKSYHTLMSSGNQSHCAGYLNWAQVTDGAGGTKWIPAIGHVIGAAYIKKAGLNNDRAWTPPGGIETTLRGVIQLTGSDLTKGTINYYVTSLYCNVIEYVRNIGYIVSSSRTYSSNSLFHSIHVRLFTNYLKNTLPDQNRQFLQKLNTPSLRADIFQQNYLVFKLYYDQGAIEGSIPFEEAVVITVETNVADRKNVEVKLAYIPTECTEHINIVLARNDGVLVLNEV
jgi:hypothetical protein